MSTLSYSSNVVPVNGTGATPEGPISPDNFKRAVYRAPPAHFTVEMLPPTKQGSSYTFGMRISPIFRGDRSSTSSNGSSLSSSSSSQEYDIWRRWEDCLWFQEVIETEYSRMARSKKQRLLKGKGVKKNGIYKQDMASSWESLPPGPDPSSIAQDIHDLIPKLSKKGTIFRASQATIDQRNREITAFVAAIFQEDAPALIRELRADRIVTDFFGYWRRDLDIARKDKRHSGESGNRSSITSSILSSYFSSSATSVASMDALSTSTSPRKSSNPNASPRLNAKRPSRSLDGGSRPFLQIPSNPAELSNRHTGFQSIAEDEAVDFHRHIESGGQVRPYSSYNPTQEASFDAESINPRDSWQSTNTATTYLEDLNLSLPDAPAEISHRTNKSRMSVSSVATFMTQASADAVLPPRDRQIVAEIATNGKPVRRSLSAGSRRRRRVVSVMSMNGDESFKWSETDDDDTSTINTINSAFYDSFPLPSFNLPSSLFMWQHNNQPDVSLPDSSAGPLPLDIPSEVSDRPDSMFFASSESPSTPSTATMPRFVTPSERRTSQSSEVSSSLSSIHPDSLFGDRATGKSTPVPVSPASSVTSMLNSPPTSAKLLPEASPVNGSITLKVIHNESIILLRIPRDIDFPELRRRIQEKFVGQERVLLAESFTVAVMLSSNTIKSSLKPLILPGRYSARTRARSSSLSSVGSDGSTGSVNSSATSATTPMKIVLSDDDWAKVLMGTEGSKMSIRVLERVS